MSRAGDVAGVRRMLGASDPLAADPAGKSALDYARLYGHREVVDAIIEFIDQNEAKDSSLAASLPQLPHGRTLQSLARSTSKRATSRRPLGKARKSTAVSLLDDSFPSSGSAAQIVQGPTTSEIASEAASHRQRLAALREQYAAKAAGSHDLHAPIASTIGAARQKLLSKGKHGQDGRLGGPLQRVSRDGFAASLGGLPPDEQTNRLLSNEVPDPNGVEITALQRKARAKGLALLKDRAEIGLEAFLRAHRLEGGRRFSRKEKHALREFFEFLDDDGSGAVDGEELEDPLFSTGVVRNHRELQEVLDSVDIDGNGELDFQELLEALLPGAGGFSSQELVQHVEGTGLVESQAAAAVGLADGRRKVVKGAIPHDERAMARVRRQRLMAHCNDLPGDKRKKKRGKGEGKEGGESSRPADAAALHQADATSATQSPSGRGAVRRGVSFEPAGGNLKAVAGADAQEEVGGEMEEDDDAELERPRRASALLGTTMGRERVNLRLKAASSIADRVDASSRAHKAKVRQESQDEAARIGREERLQLSQLGALSPLGAGGAGSRAFGRGGRRGSVTSVLSKGSESAAEAARRRFEATVRRGRQLDKQRKLVMERRTLRRKARARLQLAQYLAGKSEDGVGMEPHEIARVCESIARGMFEVPVPGLEEIGGSSAGGSAGAHSQASGGRRGGRRGDRRVSQGSLATSGAGVETAGASLPASPAIRHRETTGFGWGVDSELGSLPLTAAQSRIETVGLASRFGHVGGRGGRNQADRSGNNGLPEGDLVAGLAGGQQSPQRGGNGGRSPLLPSSIPPSGGLGETLGAQDVVAAGRESLLRLRADVYAHHERSDVEGMEPGATLSPRHKMRLLRAMPRPKGANVPHYRMGALEEQVKGSLAELAKAGDAIAAAKKEALLGKSNGGDRAKAKEVKEAAGGGTTSGSLSASLSTPILDRWNMGATAARKAKGNSRQGGKGGAVGRGGGGGIADGATLRGGDQLTHDGAMSVAIPTEDVLREQAASGQVKGGLALQKLREVLLADGGDEWKQRLELPSRLIMHRRGFLLSTVLNARRIEAVVTHLLEAGIEEAREAGDTEALSRLSVLKNRQYERQLERSERLSALRSILTRTLDERRQDRAEKEEREDRAMREAAMEMRGGAEEAGREDTAATARDTGVLPRQTQDLGAINLSGSCPTGGPSNASSRRSSVDDGQAVEHSRHRILDPRERPASALSTLFDPREFASDAPPPSVVPSRDRAGSTGGRQRAASAGGFDEREDAEDGEGHEATSRRRAAVWRFQTAVRTVMLTIRAERGMKAKAQGRAAQFLREIMKVGAQRAQGTEPGDGDAGNTGAVATGTRLSEREATRARAGARQLVAAAVRAGQAVATGEARGTGQSNSRQLEVLPGFDDASQPHLNEALAADVLRSPAVGVVEKVRRDSRRGAALAGARGGGVLLGGTNLGAVALKARERRQADALNAADGVSAAAARTRLGAAGAMSLGVGRPAKTAAPGVVGSVGGLGGLVDAVKKGKKLLKKARRRQKQQTSHAGGGGSPRAEGGTPRGMQFDIGSTAEQQAQLASIRASAEQDAASVLAAARRGSYR